MENDPNHVNDRLGPDLPEDEGPRTAMMIIVAIAVVLAALYLTLGA